MAIVLWFIALGGLVVATVTASSRGRSAPADIVGRRVIATVAIAYAAIVIAAAWTWGGATASEGRAALIARGAPVSVVLDGVRVLVGEGIAIGHGAAAGVQVPGENADELARIEEVAGKLVVRPVANTVAISSVGADDEPAEVATKRGCAHDAAAFELPAGAAVVVIECGEGKPRGAVVVRHARVVGHAGQGPRDAAATASKGDADKARHAGAVLMGDARTAEGSGSAVVVAPLAWRGRFVPERLVARAGDVVRIGAGEPVPGLASWDTVAPRASSAIVAIPVDPTACAAWSIDGRGRGREATCVVETGAFTLVATPLVPDAAQVVERSLLAVLVVGAPGLLVVVVLGLMPRHRRRTHVFAKALRLCLLGAALAALACWRLLWAHRIDAMRELSGAGALLVDNQIAVIAVGAALAGNAALVLARAQRVGLAVAAWAAWLALGWLASGSGLPALTPTLAGVVALSLTAALLPVGSELARRLAAVAHALSMRLAAQGASASSDERTVDTCTRSRAIAAWIAGAAPEVMLAVIAIAGVVAKAAAPRLTFAKLVLAYAVALLARDAVRVLLAPETPLTRRARIAVTLGAAALAVARYDTGIALAIAGTGLLLALLVAGHDAMYDATKSARIGLLEGEYARVVLVQAVAAIALFAGVAVWAVGAGDQELFARGATAVTHAPLVMAVMFALAALVARSHRRGWAPWVAAALAALALWGARADLVERVIDGDSTSARRVAAHVDPGYALLVDERAFAASVSAWREAALAPTADLDAWRGEGYFAARIRDPGVARSIDNDYLPVLVARELGIGGLVQGIALIVLLAVGAGAIANARLAHTSREYRLRTHAIAIVCVLALYQPLAALGVVPLTGISWPGLGIDSPSDLWLFVIAGVWCLLAGESPPDDERVRATPRLVRARRLVVAALVAGGVAAVILVGRAGASALARVATDDTRIAGALQYADTLACDEPPEGGDALVPADVGGTPLDGATERFDRELRAAFARARPAFVDAAARGACEGRAGEWQLSARGDTCVAQLSVGWPTIEVTLARAPRGDGAVSPAAKKAASSASAPGSGSGAGSASPAAKKGAGAASRSASASGSGSASPSGSGSASAPGSASTSGAGSASASASGAASASASGAGSASASGSGSASALGSGSASASGDHLWQRATCRVVLDDRAVGMLRARPPAAPAPRIRVVSSVMGVAATDLGEFIAGGRVVRLRPNAPALELGGVGTGTHAAGTLVLAPGISVEASPRGPLLRGPAELFVTDGTAWRRVAHGGELVIERMSLLAAGPAERRTLVLFRPPRAWGDGKRVVDALLADEARSLGERTRRLYPYGAALPELGWVNPFALGRSLGLDGWIHAALAARGRPAPAACGTLAPPAIERGRVCSTSPLDGVLECRVTVQPELAQALRGLVDELLADPRRFTGRDVTPVRAAYVVLRGDTGELLAQGNVVPDRAPLAYAPADARAEAELVRLREERGESDRERVEWNLPIAVGSTFKPIVARALERAAPQHATALELSAAGAVGGCPRGKVDPLLGHCPPTSLAGQPTVADLHDFLARSPNWYQAALGMIGLALPDGKLFAGDAEVTFADVVASDVSSWPTDRRLEVADASGTIVGKRSVSIDGLRRTPLWTHVERLLGRPLCTLGDRARCERAAARADVCAARALPVAAGADLRYLVALGPDRVVPYADDRPGQRAVPVREYLQLLRGSGVHAIGSLAQLTDAFGRVVFDPRAQPQLAASWFPAPVTGTVPTWSCAAATGRTPSVLGADGGLCAVLREQGTAHAAAGALLAEPHVVVYGAKTGTIDTLADVARRRSSCAAWNRTHGPRAQLACGKAPPDDSLFVVAFGVETPHGIVPITLGLQLQRAGSGAAARATPAFVRATARYLRGP